MMMRKKWYAALAAVVSAAFVLGGCGNGEDFKVIEVTNSNIVNTIGSLDSNTRLVARGTFDEALIKEISAAMLKLQDKFSQRVLVFFDLSGVTSLNTIPEKAFIVEEIDGSTTSTSSCCNIAGIILPASVTRIGKQAFWGSLRLESVEFATGSQLKEIGDSAFQGCSNLTSIDIPASVTKLGNTAFSSCGLASITLPSALQEIEGYTFFNCVELTTIEIPATVTKIGAQAFGETKLTSVTFKDSESKWKAEREYFDPEDLESKTEIKEFDVSDAVANATYLKETYLEYELSKKTGSE